MRSRIPTAAEIRGADRGYLAYHAPRYEYVLGLASRYLPAGPSRILEIGPSPLLPLLAGTFGCAVDSLGLEPEATGPHGRHFHFDLNDCSSRPEPPGLPRYDLVVFAEVIEHLHTSPLHVLSFVRGLLGEAGILLLQTPNAASLPKRLKLLAGRNPYEEIRPDAGNPGHFREYTLRELRGYARRTRLEVVEVGRRFYFDARYAHHDESSCRPEPLLGAIKNGVYRALPPFLREGLTLVLRRGG
jgi:SAM-dependent methyltransferase